MRNPLAAFADPVRRPRAIILLGTTLLVIFAFYGVSMMLTSTQWFCNDACHNVHADNEKTFYAGSHSQVSCMACHYRPNMDPARFAIDRIDKLLDLYPTIAGTFEMPLNEHSRLALRTPSYQCTQCHSSMREVTPSRGMLIDHQVHEKQGISCAVCHNRVAHPEKFAYTLPGNAHHEDFMKMRACFRCHTLTETSPSTFRAPGSCSACHTADFDLVPPSHDAKGWYTAGGDSTGHAKAALADAKEVAEAKKEWADIRTEFLDRQPRVLMRIIDVDTERPLDVPPAAAVSECDTCHVRSKFCDVCHGLQIPHPATFAKEHPAKFTEKDATSCAMCHNKSGSPANDAKTCQMCHHPAWNPAASWTSQHPAVVKDKGSDACFACHRETFCSSCHVRGTPSTPY